MTEPAIDTGMILEALNDKVDRDCRNVDTTSGADAVIEYQIPTAANNYTWYRLYKSGWVEQGGKTSNINDYGTLTVNLPITMNDTNYTATFGCGWNGTNDDTTWMGAFCERLPNRTTSSFLLYSRSSTTKSIGWEVKGIAAQS